VIFPAVAIALLMLAFTFLGDGLRDALDPRLQTASSHYAEPQREESTRSRPLPGRDEELRKAA
jgi:hypothetical protein